jgi:hypothetical protein
MKNGENILKRWRFQRLDWVNSDLTSEAQAILLGFLIKKLLKGGNK